MQGVNGESASLAALVRRMDATQWLDPDAMAALQFRKLDLLTLHLERHSAQFKGLLRQAGLKRSDLLSSHGLQQLPLLSRRRLQDCEGLYCETLPKSHLPTYETQTSGSTGEPVVVRRTAVNAWDWMATTMRNHLWHERNFLTRFCSVRGNNPDHGMQRDWGPPVSWLLDSGPLLGIPVTFDIDRQLELIRDFQPQFLMIYPSILAAFVRRSAALPGLRGILTLGETLSPKLREDASSLFDVTIADTYSSQELGTIAIQCPASAFYHVMAENMIVEILKADGTACGEGETGRVVVTDLRNLATPLIRYDIGDYAQVGPRCPCGRGLPTLSRVLGRERNLVLMPDGTRHWPMVGFALFRDTAPVLQYQIVQDGRTTLEMRLVTSRRLSVREESGLTALVQQALGFAFTLRFSYFENAIPLGPGGKFDEFHCLL